MRLADKIKEVVEDMYGRELQDCIDMNRIDVNQKGLVLPVCFSIGKVEEIEISWEDLRNIG